MKETKYKLFITSLDAQMFSPRKLMKRIECWVKRSGAHNISSGVVRCDIDEEKGTMLYSIHFDSSHWTGIDFQGFDKKNPGTPVTEI